MTMKNTLILGDASYSSWSMRAGLLVDRFDLPVRTYFIRFGAGAIRETMAPFHPARTVPTWITPERIAIGDSLAIAEEMAARFPDKALWPQDPSARAAARTITAEMHSGFMALREHCPMNLRTAYTGVDVPDAVKEDLARIERIWSWARDYAAAKGPWLLGSYSIADAFFAPVAMRIAGYGLDVGPDARDYVEAHLNDPAFRRWRAFGFAKDGPLERYRNDYDQVAWPGPASSLVAKSVPTGPAVNASCPFGEPGAPRTHFAEAGGQVFGFCNEVCRDQVVYDAEAWPAFMTVYKEAQEAA